MFARLGLQNLLRRPARTAMLVVGIALSTGAVFASFTVARAIQASMDRSFARMGADLIVVPADTMVNITSALLTVQPTGHTLDAGVAAQIRRLANVSAVATQRMYRVPVMAGMAGHSANLIAFDPADDFTVRPWIKQRLGRAMRRGDVLAGARREEAMGEELELCGGTQNVYARLALTGVGPFDESLFTTFDTAGAIAAARKGCIADYDPHRISAVLVRLVFGATSEQVRFAIAQIPGVKVVAGGAIMTSTRQTMTALLAGVAAFTILMLLGTLIMVSLLFSAIIAERRREVGLLRAVGARRSHVTRMLVAEAGFTTGLGGLCGIAFGAIVLLLFERSLGYLLKTMRIEFIWPPAGSIVAFAIICAGLAAMVGVAGAVVPAWKASGEDPYVLIQGEGG
jgi:putative ABC transport system permease protein